MLRYSVRALAKKSAAKKGGSAAAAAAAAASVPLVSDPPPAKELAAAARARRAAGKLRFDAYKAGLQMVDKAHVEQVIQEASKGTPFYLKEQRREEARRVKAEAALRKAEEYKQLSQPQKNAIRERVDALEKELESTRDVRRRYIHVDMDMFYAAVEEKKNPALRDVPFGVGSLTMLSTTNYIARQYGVRSGMPGFIGKKLCPDLLIVPVDFAAYRREAAVVHSVAARYDTRFVSVGLDELTMDVTDYLKEFPYLTAAQIATDFRDEVFAKTQLTCSGGIAPTSTLAKIASNVNKPNGQHEITLLDRADFLKYVKDIPLRKIPGIGYAQENMLNALGVRNCGDLLKHKYMLAYLFKEKTFEHYLAVGLGLMGSGAHKQQEPRMSIGKEVSFSEPLASPKALSTLFRSLLEPCHVQCVREHIFPKQMKLVLKYRTYDTQQFSASLPRHTNDLKLWLEAAKTLLQPHLDDYAELRLVGVRMQKLAPEGGAEAVQAAVGTGSPSVAATSRPQATAAAAGGRKVRADSPATKAVDADSEEDKLEVDEEDEHHRANDGARDRDGDAEGSSAARANRKPAGKSVNKKGTTTRTFSSQSAKRSGKTPATSAKKPLKAKK